ncbi:SidA/IucD/PvdA family monooxygenase [Pseudomonas brassicacearum]|uniref:Ornithine monooxygenase n=1 Tax=Pseudomonas brassicacearum TaxID=930166 RepID=A0A423GJE9_9PSED|nr:SidA/IucD/PvdA family monooxygenase [Pseudomonas brassicacearum]ROM90330.1 ornithine monooxygenase [Pseudomonas brassicacearum]
MQTYDIVGIGFGPANIALAIALEEYQFTGSRLFLERRAGPSWQPEMLLPGSDIQNHPCRDLVTPRNPRSRYTFMNFLVENQRLFDHLNLGLEFPLRYEYAQYVSWVADFFSKDVRYGTAVGSLRLDPYDPNLFIVTTEAGESIRARSVVVAPGRTPLIPTLFADCDPAKVFHLTEFNHRLEALGKMAPLQHIAVIGGSQSAAELVLHLRDRCPDAQISNVMRAYGYRLKDTSQFSEHVYFPEFVDYYYNLSGDGKKRINQHLHYTNYSAVDKDLITSLYARMYEDRLRQAERIRMASSSEILSCDLQDGTQGRLQLEVKEVNTGAVEKIENIDAIVLATGFRNLGVGEGEESCPPILKDLHEHLTVNQNGILHIQRDYSLSARDGHAVPPLYLNGLCESSHGYGDAGSFSLLALRARDIYESLSGKLENSAVSRRPDACTAAQKQRQPVCHTDRVAEFTGAEVQ